MALADKFGNPITETAPSGNNGWIFTRTVGGISDGLTLNYLAFMAQGVVETNAINVFNAMVPPANYVSPLTPNDISTFCNLMMNAAIASNNASFIVASAQFIPVMWCYLTLYPPFAQAYWTALKASPPSWLTAGAITSIQGYATASNFTLS